MKIFNTKKTESPVNKLPRIAKLSDSELLSWFDSAIMNLGSHFDSWRYHDGPSEEVDTVLTALNGLWSEIKEREDGRSPS